MAGRALRPGRRQAESTETARRERVADLGSGQPVTTPHGLPPALYLRRSLGVRYDLTAVLFSSARASSIAVAVSPSTPMIMSPRSASGA